MEDVSSESFVLTIAKPASLVLVLLECRTMRYTVRDRRLDEQCMSLYIYGYRIAVALSQLVEIEIKGLQHHHRRKRRKAHTRFTRVRFYRKLMVT